MLICAIAIGPGLLPLLADFFSDTGLLDLPAFANRHIFRLLAVAVYIACLPVFVALLSNRSKWIMYPLFAMISCAVVWWFAQALQPMPSEGDQRLASNIFVFFLPYILVFGGVAGSLVGLVSRFPFKGKGERL
jgi:hypothetical protein